MDKYEKLVLMATGELSDVTDKYLAVICEEINKEVEAGADNERGNQRFHACFMSILTSYLVTTVNHYLENVYKANKGFDMNGFKEKKFMRAVLKEIEETIFTSEIKSEQ